MVLGPPELRAEIHASIPVDGDPPTDDAVFGSPADDEEAGRWIAAVTVPPRPWPSTEAQEAPRRTWRDDPIDAALVPQLLDGVAETVRAGAGGQAWASACAGVVAASVGYLLPTWVAAETFGAQTEDGDEPAIGTWPIPFPAVTAVFDCPLVLTLGHRRSLPDRAMPVRVAPLRSRGGSLVGVTLLEGSHRQDRPVVWIVADADGRLELIPGRRTEQNARLLDDLAAFLSWGDWSPPSERSAGGAPRWHAPQA